MKKEICGLLTNWRSAEEVLGREYPRFPRIMVRSSWNSIG
jgi:hypothetical protein